MGSTQTPIAEPERRQFFARVVKSIQSVIAAVVGVVAGGAILSPGFARREESWFPVGLELGTLIDNAPTPATLRVAREDGYNQIVERRVVLLVKTAEAAAKDRPKTERKQPAETPRKVAASMKKIR